MFEHTPRLRIRSTGLDNKFVGVYELGQLYIENGVGSEDWHPLGAPKTGSLDAPWVSWERTVDELHGRPPYYDGGPFESIKIDRRGCTNGLVGSGTYKSMVPFSFGGYYGRLKYQGGFAPPSLAQIGVSGLDVGNEALINGLIPDIQTLGSQVWDRLKPKIEQGGLFVAIAEARDVPRMLRTSASFFKSTWETMFRVKNSARWKDVYYPLKQSRLMQPKFLADQFLNEQFGWSPFIKDLKDLLSNVIHYTERLRRLAAENGQWIRRRTILVNNTDHKIISSGVGVQLYPMNVLGGVDWTMFYDPGSPYVPPHWEVMEDKVTYATAVGSFRYWLPEFAGPLDDTLQGRLNIARATLDLFGLRASPSNIYKAIPWTWLIDWVTGVGRSIQAIQDQTLDSMVAKYMAMSHHVVTTRTFRQVLPFTKSNGGSKTFEFTQLIDVKQRKMATSPFGFYLDASALTGRQLAILGALGVSRKRWGRH